jgi:hypothetical protein
MPPLDRVLDSIERDRPRKMPAVCPAATCPARIGVTSEQPCSLDQANRLITNRGGVHSGSRLTAKVTANGSDSCRSGATQADSRKPFTCIDGLQRTALDRPGRVRSPPVTPRLARNCGVLLRSATVEVAASPPAVHLWPELAFQLHQAPDPGAVGAEVRLDLGGQFVDSGQVDAEQLRAPLQRRRDRPAQGPGRTRSYSNR